MRMEVSRGHLAAEVLPVALFSLNSGSPECPVYVSVHMYVRACQYMGKRAHRLNLD